MGMMGAVCFRDKSPGVQVAVPASGQAFPDCLFASAACAVHFSSATPHSAGWRMERVPSSAVGSVGVSDFLRHLRPMQFYLLS